MKLSGTPQAQMVCDSSDSRFALAVLEAESTADPLEILGVIERRKSLMLEADMYMALQRPEDSVTMNALSYQHEPHYYHSFISYI